MATEGPQPNQVRKPWFVGLGPWMDPAQPCRQTSAERTVDRVPGPPAAIK